MHLLKRLGVFALSSISIFLIILLAFSFTLNSFLYPKIYAEAFEKAGVYQYIDNNLEKAQGASFIAFPDGSKKVIDSLLSNFLEYLRSDTDNLNLSVQIDQQKLRDFFLDSVKNTSECKPNQDPFGQNPCLPKGKTSEVFLDEFLESKNLTFFESKDVDLTKIYRIEEQSEGRKSLDKIRDYIKYCLSSSIILSVIILVLISIIYLIERPNTNRFIMLISFIFFIPSIVLFTAAYTLGSVNNLITLPDQLLIKLVNAVTTLLSKKLIFTAIISLVLSLALFIFSFVVKEKPVVVNNIKPKNKPKK